MNWNAFITCAITGAGDTVGRSPAHVPGRRMNRAVGHRGRRGQGGLGPHLHVRIETGREPGVGKGLVLDFRRAFALGVRGAQERRTVRKAARYAAQDLPLPQGAAPWGGQRRKPYEQAGEEVRRTAGAASVCIPCPSWSPESNPVELVWWSLHEAVSRNHECAGLDDLVELAESYLQERAAFQIEARGGLRAVGKGAALSSGECPFISWSYLVSVKGGQVELDSVAAVLTQLEPLIMIVDRYDPVNLFQMVPKLKLEFELELAELDVRSRMTNFSSS